MSKLYVDAITNREGVNAVNFPDGITGTAATFSGNVTIGGTLTYEDVTNIDSVGLITARSGLVVTGGGAVITGVLTATSFDGSINTVGIITAGSFVGDGSGLTFAPKVIAFNPAALGTGIAVDTNITITFDQNIQFGGTGTIELRSAVYSGPTSEWESNTGNLIESFAITSGTPASGLSISGTQLIITPTSDLPSGSTIYIILPSQGIQGTSGNLYYAGSNNYTFRTVASSFSVQGGDYEFISASPTSPTGYYKYHIFSSSGILTTTNSTPTADSFQMLMMAGGGGGGVGGPGPYQKNGGGGGAGGRISRNGPEANLPAGTYTVTVGAAGYGGWNQSGIGTMHPNYPGSPTLPAPSSYNPYFYATNGTDTSISGSTISTLTAIGGGHGAHAPLPPGYYRYGRPGGSGGGTGADARDPTAGAYIDGTLPYASVSPTFVYSTSGQGVPGQGYPGGGYLQTPVLGYLPTTPYYAGPNGSWAGASGGGGGSGGAGGNATVFSSYFAPNPTFPTATDPYRAGFLYAGSGGAGAANPEFPAPQLAGGLPGDYTDLLTVMGPTGLLGGGGGGARHPNWPTNPPTANPLQPIPAPIQWRGIGGPGGGGSGAGEGVSPEGLPQYEAGNGVQYTGSGGGGGLGGPSYYAGHGGSGIVMIRYAHPGT